MKRNNVVVASLDDLRLCHVRTVIEVERAVGAGTKDDPHRIVSEYYSMEGELLARTDPTQMIRK